MHSRSKIILFATCTLLAVVMVAAWKLNLLISDQSEEEKQTEKPTSQREIRPPQPSRDIDPVMRGGENQDHELALNLADRIARERIELSAEDSLRLMEFITGEKPSSLDAGEWQHRVNSILNALRAQKAYNEDLSDLLMRMAVESKDPVLRLYAVQHLGAWLPREESEDKKQQALSLLKQLATKDGGQMAGTAIQMINELEQTEVGLTSADIKLMEKAALRIAADPEASHDLRVSALHTCCDRNLVQILDDARKIASDGNEITIVRKAAVYSIGKMGSEKDIGMLEKLLPEGELLSAAIRPAIKNIRKRSESMAE